MLGAARDGAGRVHLLTGASYAGQTPELTIFSQAGGAWTSTGAGAYATPAFAVGPTGLPLLGYEDPSLARLFVLHL